MLTKTFFTSTLLIILTIFFSGCGSSKIAPPKKIEVPKWITIQPQDTINTTYGIGIAKDRQTALEAALNDVISKLGIKVESSFNYKQIVDGHYSKSISTNNIKTDVAKIRITNYDVEKSHRISYREYAILVKVDNTKFYTTLAKDISQTQKNIETKLKSSLSKDAISRYNIKKLMLKECDRLISNALVAHELNSGFSTKKYFDFVTQVKNTYYTKKKSLKFSIYGDENSKNFIQIIKKQLINNDFNIVNTRDSNTVDIKLNTVDDKTNNKGIVNIKVSIKVTQNNESLGSNIFTLKERNKSSKLNVYNAAAIHFEKDVKTIGIYKALGININ